jgi:hypothetical protein
MGKASQWKYEPEKNVTDTGTLELMETGKPLPDYSHRSILPPCLLSSKFRPGVKAAELFHKIGNECQEAENEKARAGRQDRHGRPKK